MLDMPDAVLEVMASAMLEPNLRSVKTASGNAIPTPATASGNIVRKKILLRALEAAKIDGWALQKISD